MKQTIYLSDFRQAFKDMNRQNQFSYDGLEALYNMLEDCAPDYELDVIALCCDYSEGSMEDLANDFGISERAVVTYLEDNTWFTELPNGSFIYQQF